MIESEIEIKLNTKQLPLEYKLLEFRLKVNKDLYDDKVINYEVFKEMENILLGRITKIRNECFRHKSDFQQC